MSGGIVVFVVPLVIAVVASFVYLRRGLAKWDRGETGEALWEWRFNFENHWGEHLTGALRALYILAARYEFNWPGGERGPA